MGKLYENIVHRSQEEKKAFDEYVKAKNTPDYILREKWIDKWLYWLHLRNKEVEVQEEEVTKDYVWEVKQIL